MARRRFFSKRQCIWLPDAADVAAILNWILSSACDCGKSLSKDCNRHRCYQRLVDSEEIVK